MVNKTKVNMNQREQRSSTLLGVALLFRSLTRRSLGGMVLAIILLYRGISGHCYLYQILGINRADRKQSESETSDDASTIERSITVEKPATELNRFWREPESLSKIMGDFVEVTRVSHDRAHWRIRGPFGRNVEWETQIVEDRPGEILRWKSINGTRIPSEVSVRFRPAPKDWGTEATLHFRIERPGGLLANWRAKRLSMLPRILAEKGLRRFKSLAETGEVPTLEHNPHARAGAHVY
jgi:uncharacterized membrane protein